MHLFSKKFPERRAFITGAASGLGKEICLILAKDNWTIGMADIREDALASAAGEIEKTGATVYPLMLDVGDKENYRLVAEDFLSKAGGIDLLVNNAGVGDGGLFEEYSLENWEWIVQVNQMSVVYGCHYFLPWMKKQGSGHIINTASVAAVSCAPRMAAYNTTKAAVLAISETLYSELHEYNIGVSCLMPYFFKTDIAQFARGGDLIKKSTEAFMRSSGLKAPEVAKEALKRSAKGELYILIPRVAHNMWLMKRIIPTKFRDIVRKSIGQAFKKVEKRS